MPMPTCSYEAAITSRWPAPASRKSTVQCKAGGEEKSHSRGMCACGCSCACAFMLYALKRLVRGDERGETREARQ
jgi:hypothetical protein